MTITIETNTEPHRTGPVARQNANRFELIAGPCTVESRGQALETARAVKAAGSASDCQLG